MHESETPIRVFVGSSAEGREIALNLQDQLESHGGCEVDLWEHVFEPSGYALPSLLSVAAGVDFAVLIATPDDTTVSRGKAQESVRDNIILEFGLFAGALGLNRTYLLATGTGVKLPSDVFGLTRLRYRERADGKIAPALNSAVLAIKQQIDTCGARVRLSVAQADLSVSDTETEEIESLVRDKRRSYPSASAFYRDFENGKWLKSFKLPSRLDSASARKALKDKWLQDADFTRSWDHSNIVFMQLELVVDYLTRGDLDQLLDLPTTDSYGHEQQAGLQQFLEFIENRNPALCSSKVIERLSELRNT